jgi:hypothetical protein
MLARELDDELGEDVDDDVLDAGEGVLEEGDALLDREERLLVRGKIAAERRITSMCPFVTGSYEPGQIAVIISRTP